jgi:ATP-dependent exoDNAse (exonuclease V) beta subunit
VLSAGQTGFYKNWTVIARKAGSFRWKRSSESCWTKTGFYEEMGAGFGGAQRQANLNALLDKAHAFEAAGKRGIWSFLRHIELAKSGASVGAAQTVTADVVRILTILNPKDLNFRLCSCAGSESALIRKTSATVFSCMPATEWRCA